MELDNKEFADNPDLSTYHAKPVQNYGMGLLKSMGFTKERGIGKHPQNALSEPLVLKPRPRGLGLGAQNEKEEKKAQFLEGDRVIIKEGPHEGLIGFVQQINSEEVIVELKISGSTLKCAIKSIKKITKEEAGKMQQATEGEEKKKKRLKWMVPNIKLKVIDKKSQYYLKKVLVSEVPSAKEFYCVYRDHQGQQHHINDLRQKDVQTVLPGVGGMVMIVRGSHIGEKATLMQRDKKKQKVVVQTQTELELVTVQEDDVSELIDC